MYGCCTWNSVDWRSRSQTEFGIRRTRNDFNSRRWLPLIEASTGNFIILPRNKNRRQSALFWNRRRRKQAALSLWNQDQLMARAQQGFGSVHHIAFRVKDRERLRYWDWTYAKHTKFLHPGYVDRFLFSSHSTHLLLTAFYLGLQPMNRVLLMMKSPTEILGETLASSQNSVIIANRMKNRSSIKYLVRSTKTLEKKYFGFDK